MVERVKCKYCGKEVQKINLKDHEYECNKNSNSFSKLKGLGGWLVLVQIGLILGAIIYLITSIIFFIDKEFQYSLIFGVLFLFLAIYEGYTLLLMYKRDYKFPTFAIWGLWLPFGVYLLATLISLFSGNESISSASELGQVTGGVLIMILPSIIWTLYFKKSKRVKNTFTKR